jgi:hypothetical protein
MGSMIAPLASSDWGAIDKLLIVLAIAHCAFYLFVPNFADYVEPLIPLLASNYLHGAPVYADWTGMPARRSSAAFTALMFF